MPIQPVETPRHESVTVPVMLLRKSVTQSPRQVGPSLRVEEPLPEPPFPQHPEHLSPQPLPTDGVRHWTAGQIWHAMQGWAVPYLKSRVLPGDFHPIVAYLFTEYKCNLDCHYCYSYDNRVKGMTEPHAKAAIDWLHETTCRALALMGGEVLLRPKFVHKVVDYAAKRGFWIYIPTNARLLKLDVIDRLADAGVATFNIATDSVDEKPSLPKALTPIRPQLEYLLRQQYRYGYTIFLNINICRNNLDDVRALTEFAHEHKIATDYHINERPLLDQGDHFKHAGDDNETYIRPEDHPKVSALLDWLIDRQQAGYQMTNSVQRLAQMKDFMHNELEPWNCRAGRNTVIIRVDGTLAPCFPMYSASHDWGTIGAPKFDPDQLREMKTSCEKHCFSTLNHIVGYCYNDRRVINWMWKQAQHGFQGVRGNF